MKVTMSTFLLAWAASTYIAQLMVQVRKCSSAAFSATTMFPAVSDKLWVWPWGLGYAMIRALSQRPCDALFAGCARPRT